MSKSLTQVLTETCEDLQEAGSMNFEVCQAIIGELTFSEETRKSEETKKTEEALNISDAELLEMCKPGGKLDNETSYSAEKEFDLDKIDGLEWKDPE